MRAYIFDVIRSLVPKLSLDSLFVSKQELADSVQSQLKEAFEKFGIEITGKRDAAIAKAMPLISNLLLSVCTVLSDSNNIEM